MEPFHHGVDKIWNIPCFNPPNNFESKFGGEATTPISRCYPGWNSASQPHTSDKQKECPITDLATSATSHCFRGVHDDVISKYEVDQTLRLGNSLILNGGDHFDVHYDVSHLNQRIPSVVTKLERLLHERYNQSHFQPVAFRVQTAGPMDFHGVNLFHTSALTLNQTVSLLALCFRSSGSFYIHNESLTKLFVHVSCCFTRHIWTGSKEVNVAMSKRSIHFPGLSGYLLYEILVICWRILRPILDLPFIRQSF